MKALLIASMFMGGGSAIALQNEAVQGTVEGVANQISARVGNMFKGNKVLNVQENGFAYPSEAYLSTLTEDQAFAITSAIDVINASYDWASMTDEEVLAVLDQAHATLQALYSELGIAGPATQTQTRSRLGQSGEKGKGHSKGNGRDESFVPSGDGLQDGSCLEDDAVTTDGDIV